MTATSEKNVISSNTLMSNKPSVVKISQNGEKGICFTNGNGKVYADANNVLSTQNCVAIGNQNIQIGLIEHFMAALAICHIDSLQVEVNENEMPILDGSSKEWIEFFERNDLKKAEDKTYVLKEPVYFTKDKTTIVVLPDETFSVTYCIDFKNKDLENRWVKFDGSNLNEISEARTFGYLKDLEKFQAMGFALGVSEKNTVGLTEDGYTTELRSQFEPAKHKILDLLGDFYLSGFNPLQLKARVIAHNAGHSTHVEVAKILKNIITEEK